MKCNVQYVNLLYMSAVRKLLKQLVSLYNFTKNKNEVFVFVRKTERGFFKKIQSCLFPLGSTVIHQISM